MNKAVRVFTPRVHTPTLPRVRQPSLSLIGFTLTCRTRHFPRSFRKAITFQIPVFLRGGLGLRPDQSGFGGGGGAFATQKQTSDVPTRALVRAQSPGHRPTDDLGH